MTEKEDLIIAAYLFFFWSRFSFLEHKENIYWNTSMPTKDGIYKPISFCMN
jgi:hypothetical protein